MRLLVIICTFMLGLFIHRCQANFLLEGLDNLTPEQLQALTDLVEEAGGTLEDTNECELATSPCPEFSTCANSVGSFNCTCNSGFTPTGTGENGDAGCEDIDECTAGTPCADIADSTCQNNPGGYECCSDGFEVNTDGNACVDIDECAADSNPCVSLDGSTCHNNDGSFDCVCELGYQPNVEMTACVDIDECGDATTCSDLTGSECNNAAGSYTCDCPTGFVPVGDVCEDIDECDTGPCDGIADSTCGNTDGSFQCNCETGYEVNMDMTACVDIDECDPTDIMHNCGTNQVCENNEGAFTCVCAEGYEPDTDTTDPGCTDIDECDQPDGNSPCDSETEALCINAAGSYSCVCQSGFFGSGLAGQCTDSSSCSTFDALKTSISAIQLADADADVSTHKEVLDNYFSASGKPEKVPGDLYRAVYDGDLDPSIDRIIDDLRCDYFSSCSEDNSTGATVYTCSCNVGYQFVTDSVTQCEDIDECADSPCGSMAECDNNLGSYICICPDGYELSGGANNDDCVDINECTRETDNCDDNADCANNEGSFICTCKDGYMGPGVTCESATSCEAFNKVKAAIDTICFSGEDGTNAEAILGYYNAATGRPDGVSGAAFRAKFGSDLPDAVTTAIDLLRCDYFSNCSETTDSDTTVYECSCFDGYAPTAENTNQCSDEDECGLEGDDACGDTGTCVNEQGTYMCNCSAGYDGGDGAPCSGSLNSNINECDRGDDNCDSNANCTNQEGTFDCTCKDGYMGSGQACESATSCEAFNKVKSAIDTICFSGEDGTDAEKILGYYIAATGRPDGVPGDAFRAKFGSDLPDAVTTAIDLLRCDYFSNCSETVVEDTTEYQCSCFDGYAQTDDNANQCSDEDECVSEGDDACDDTGTCVNEQGTYMCNCSVGYDGGDGAPCSDIDECTLETDECDVTGECMNKAGGYSCDPCATGYEGGEDGPCTDIDECTSETDECGFTGECVNKVGGYSCDPCATGYEGGEDGPCTDIDECTLGTDECDVTGECMNKAGGYSCDPCATGYEGGEDGPCTDINECEEGTHACDSNANCGNTVGSFKCTCDSQYMGTGHECRSVLTCEAFNDLKQAIETIQNEDPAPMARTLLQEYRDAEGRPSGITQNAFRAKFPGSLDTDIDDTLDLLRCDFFSECSYDGTAYNCTCMAGYESDGETGGCKDIDECDAENTTHDCHKHATCTNEEGSFICTCNEGYFGTDGKSCSDHDECKDEGAGNDCHEYATCTNFDGGHSCACNETYYGDGKTCQEVNTCDAFNAVKSAIFVIRNGSTEEEEAAARETLQAYHQATGKIGEIVGDSYRFVYSDDDTDPIADDISNVLDHLICDYHSTCNSDDSGTYTCTCDADHIPGDTANTCLNVQSCATFDKVKSAIATVQENLDAVEVAAAREILTAFAMAEDLAPAVEGTSYRARYGSITDDDLINALDKLPCDFFSTCSDPLTCSCMDGYQKVDDTNACTDFDECASEIVNNCHTYASCSNTEGEFECSCNDGFVGNGVDCEDRQQCTSPDSTLCGANAQCTDTVGSFECLCIDGYTGSGQICIREPLCLFSTDSDQDVENCDEFDHPLSCSFKREFAETADETFGAFRSFFHPPNELVGAVSDTRNATGFAATMGSIISGTQAICRSSSSYTSPMKAFTDPEGTMEVELFAYDCQRQWFTITECEGIVDGLNAQCTTVTLPTAALVITKDDTTGKYEVTNKRVYLPSGCQFRFNPPE